MKKNRKINIAFAGTPEIAFDIFEELSKKDFQINFILTQTDKKAGRGAQIKSSKFLEKKGIYRVLQPENLNDDDFKKIILNHNIDLLIVVAYGKILPSWLLKYPKYGCLNVHFSILPKWRGAAPMQRAIASGDKSFGVSFMKIEEKLDTGGIYKTFFTKNHGQDIYTLEKKLVEITNMNLGNTIIEICLEKIIPETQEEEKATYADKVKKEEGLIDWNIDSSQVLRNFLAFKKWPGSYFKLNDELVRAVNIENIKTITGNPGEISSFNKDGMTVCCKKGAINLKSVQFPGKKVISSNDFFNSKRDIISLKENLI
ncbi:MAG: methionyl-tRNA formyltransferase [Gammaproteobacteria bacterium]